MIALVLAAAALAGGPQCFDQPCHLTAFVGRHVEARWASSQRFANGTSLRVTADVDGQAVDLRRDDVCTLRGRARGVRIRVDDCGGYPRAFRLRLHAHNRSGVDRHVTVRYRVTGFVL